MLSNWLMGLLKRKVSKYKIVSYEALVSRPKRTITEIIEWIGVNQSNLDFFVNERLARLDVNHTVSGNPIRFKKGIIEICPDIEWLTTMPLLKKFFISMLTYPLGSRYRRMYIRDDDYDK